jgi:hypothetical protein
MLIAFSNKGTAERSRQFRRSGARALSDRTRSNPNSRRSSAPALSNFLDQIRLCLLSAKGTRGAPDPAAQDLLCGRIETTSCVVDAEGHLNATVMVEVVNTFSSFQVP